VECACGLLWGWPAQHLTCEAAWELHCSMLQESNARRTTASTGSVADSPDVLLLLRAAAVYFCCVSLKHSASNYLLGLTPVQLGPLVVGTVAGMSVWSILYASLGGASKVLLESGADLDVLLAGEGGRVHPCGLSRVCAMLPVTARLLLLDQAQCRGCRVQQRMSGMLWMQTTTCC
jgi:hypothetical protein